jgi:N-acetylglutamate synthase-like GNAT family acetyltransferase
MIQTREAHTDDEAWMIEKLNQDDQNLDKFNPRAFLLTVNDETEERLAFGRTEYIRNVDDTEFVEINSVIILDKAETQHGERLLSDLVDSVDRETQNQIFSFPHQDHEVFYSIGFSEVDYDQLPSVMKDRYDEEMEKYGENVVPLMAQPREVEFEEEEEDEYEKPSDVSENEVEQIKDDLDIDEETTTKYSV